VAQRSDLPGTIAARTRGLIGVTDADQVTRIGDGARPMLAAFTDTIRQDMALLSDALADAYFQHLSRRRMGVARWEVV
jgi:hypothetical protein